MFLLCHYAGEQITGIDGWPNFFLIIFYNGEARHCPRRGELISLSVRAVVEQNAL